MLKLYGPLTGDRRWFDAPALDCVNKTAL